MTFDGIKVTHESLRTGSGQMMTTHGEITRRLDELEAQLQLLRNDWSGSQQAAYHQAKTKWDTAMNEMGQLLRETAQAVDTSQQDYAKADQNGAQRFM